MAGGSLLNSDLYRAKLQALTPAQQSIETLSTWCMFYHSDHKQIVELWHEEFQKVAPEKRLPFLYLANDLVQNGRKKCPDMPGAFFAALITALKTLRKSSPSKDVDRAKRIVTVWGERRVYSPKAVKQLLDQLIVPGGAAAAPAAAAAAAAPSAGEKRPREHRSRHHHNPPVADEQLRQATEAANEISKREHESGKWLVALSGPCRANLEVDGTAEELLAAKPPLEKYVKALEEEVSTRQKAVEMAQAFIDSQVAATGGVEHKLGLTREHLEKIKARMVAVGAGDAEAEGGTEADDGSGAGGGAGAGADDEYDPEDP